MSSQASRESCDTDTGTLVLSPSKKRKRAEKNIPEIEVDVSAPEPPSKKAARRAKKGRHAQPAPPATSSSPHSDPLLNTPDDKAHDTVSGDEVPAKRSKHGIWIGNLPFTTTKADLRRFLIGNGSLSDDHITRIHLPGPSEKAPASAAAARQPSKPQNRGFAYVDLSTKDAMNEALGLSETLLSGRRVLIKDSTSFEGRPEKPKEQNNEKQSNLAKPSSKRIFVGNLGFDITEDILREHFARCGTIEHVHIATFEDSGKCKGFAWIVFHAVEAAEGAVRGWVKIPEPGESDSEADADQEKLKGEGDKKGKKKLRKWWVNRIKGRPLRMEFAEDQAVRYKKRFGKEDGVNKKNITYNIDGTDDDHLGTQPTIDSVKEARVREPGRSREGGRAQDGRRKQAWTAKPMKAGVASLEVSRLTGAIVQGQGKKITFD